uniref:Uncharacterized protein n=1 Tax=Parascaris univalens TaxID=6257 RepID=A0A914ZJT9_PARUN
FIVQWRRSVIGMAAKRALLATLLLVLATVSPLRAKSFSAREPVFVIRDLQMDVPMDTYLYGVNPDRLKEFIQNEYEVAMNEPFLDESSTKEKGTAKRDTHSGPPKRNYIVRTRFTMEEVL